MCVRIIKSNEEVKYNNELPLMDQLLGTKEIVIDYNPKDTTINCFLDAIENYMQTGTSFNYNIKVLNNNNIMGAKIKKKITKIQKELAVNELVKKMVNCYETTDRSLEELATCCLERK